MPFPSIGNPYHNSKRRQAFLDPDQLADTWRRSALRSGADILLSTIKKKPANAAAPALPTNAAADATCSLPAATANASNPSAAR